MQGLKNDWSNARITYQPYYVNEKTHSSIIKEPNVYATEVKYTVLRKDRTT